MYSSRVIADMAQFAELRADWVRLFEADPGLTVFNSYEWNWCWLQHYWQSGDLLYVVALADTNDKVVALLPLYLRPAENRGMFVGTGEPEHEEVSSEYLDFLVDPAHAAEPALREAMSSSLDALLGWHLELRNCRPHSHVAVVLRRRRRVLRRESGVQFLLPVGPDFEATAQAFSAKQKKRSRQLLRYFDHDSELQFLPFVSGAHRENWQLLKTVHQADWEARGGEGAIKAESFSRFHRCMHERAPQFPQLFSILKKEGRVLAINHYYRHGDRYYFYLTGTNRREAKQLSPGQLLHYLCIRHLGGSGAIYDFLKGRSEASYKSKFCEPGPAFEDFIVYPEGIAGELRYLLRRCRRSLAVWRARISGRSRQDPPAIFEQGRY